MDATTLTPECQLHLEQGPGRGRRPDPINLHNDYLPLNIDRTNILNLTYSYTFGDVVRERYLGWVTNGWEIAGITNYQSGSVLASLTGPTSTSTAR